MRDVLALDEERAARRALDQGQEPRERRLAGAGFADDRERAPGLQREGDAGKRLDRRLPAESAARDVIVAAEVSRFEDRVHEAASSSRRAVGTPWASGARQRALAERGQPARARRHGRRRRRMRSAARTGSRAADRTVPARRPEWPAGAARSPAPAAPRAAPRYRDGAGSANSSRVPFVSTCWPAYCTTTRSAVSATTPMSWVMSTSPMPVSRLSRMQEIEDLRLDRHVERGRRLVGDQELGPAGERHRDHHPLAHAAGELVRKGARAPLRIGNADFAREARHARLSRARAAKAKMRPSASRRSGSRR